MRPDQPIGFAPPPIDEDTIASVARVLRSGWITTGPEVVALEQELAEFLNAKSVGCFGSWTEAAELVWRWWGLGPGDEVIVPAITFAATANVVLHCGATPVLVDVDPSDWNASADRIAEAITPRTKGVMPVDLGGWPVDYDAIRQVIESRCVLFQPKNERQSLLGRPLFFADAAHSFGGEYGGRRIAEQADFTAFSFHAVKNFTTAEGGAVVCALPEGFDRHEVMRWLKVWGLHGATRDAMAKTLGGTWEYDVVGAGYKCNMTDLQAAIGRAQLPKYPAQLMQRAELAKAYDQALKHLNGLQLPPQVDHLRKSAFHLYPLHLTGWTEPMRNDLIDRLREHGVPTNVHFIPLARLTVQKQRGEKPENYPNAERYFAGAISLPLHTGISDDQRDWITERFIHHFELISE
jgi:dTDP-4-amino-4,6-dideoxygalactose transaminase